jgi:DNA invertase Pin-like site-specific DNA recombinase
MAQAKAFSYIRFSTPEQSKGHSLERQMKAAEAYAGRKGLELDERSFKDLGVSAFEGANIREGALGAFLGAVKEGAIPKGSYLLVESLDRVSRQTAYDAAHTMRQIVEEGITVVDLSDGDGGRVYNRDSLKDGFAFIVMSIRFMRANEESALKSNRLAKVWESKRKKAANKVPMSVHCPAWLKLNADRKSYSVIKDRALTIKRIFAEAASGLGMYTITKRLNERKVPHFGKAHGWRLPYVAIILKNRAVLGEFQPHKYIDGKRMPYGDPIKGYYPAIVDQETFDRVQRGIAERRFTGAGRKGKGYSSLFARMLHCAHCESTVYVENKGRGERSLVCSNAGSHTQCPTLRWKYEHFEHAVLYFLSREIDLQSIVSGNREGDKRYLLEAAIEGLEGKLVQLDDDWKKWSAVALKVTVAHDAVAKELDRIESERRLVNGQLEQLRAEHTILVNEAQDMAGADIRALVEGLGAVSEADRYKLRSDLASNLRKLVSRINVRFPVNEEVVLAELGEKGLAELDISTPMFQVTFKNGKKEDCYPAVEDAFDQTSLYSLTRAAKARWGEMKRR